MIPMHFLEERQLVRTKGNSADLRVEIEGKVAHHVTPDEFHHQIEKGHCQRARRRILLIVLFTMTHRLKTKIKREGHDDR